MARKGGNPECVGKKGRSGRKKFEVEMKVAITNRMIEALAKNKVFQHLELMQTEDRGGIKDIALPVYLKSKAENIDITSGGKRIDIFDYVRKQSRINNSNAEDSSNESEDTSNTGRDVSEQDV